MFHMAGSAAALAVFPQAPDLALAQAAAARASRADGCVHVKFQLPTWGIVEPAKT